MFWVAFSFLHALGFATCLPSSFSDPNESYFSVGLTQAHARLHCLKLLLALEGCENQQVANSKRDHFGKPNGEGLGVTALPTRPQEHV